MLKNLHKLTLLKALKDESIDLLEQNCVQPVSGRVIFSE